MKTTIILTTITALAAAVNQAIAGSDLAVSIGPVTVVGNQAAAVVTPTANGLSTTGAPIRVAVATGTDKAVSAAFDKLQAENPYWRIVAVSPVLAAAPAAADEKPAKKPAATVFALFQLVQP